MNNDLQPDFDGIKKMTATMDVAPYQIAEKFRNLLINPEMTRDTAIRAIQDKYNREFKNATKNYEDEIFKLQSEKDKFDGQLTRMQSGRNAEIAELESQLAALQNIVGMRQNLGEMIPPSAREISDEYINEPDAWADKVAAHAGFFGRIKFNRSGAKRMYADMLRAARAAGLEYIPNADAVQRMQTQIARAKKLLTQDASDGRLRTDELQSSIAAQKAKIEAIRQKYSNQMNTDISQFLSVFHQDPRARTALRKMPPFLNMQNLTEPVAFFQNIDARGASDNYIDQIAELMRRAGLTVATNKNPEKISDPASYILRRSEKEKDYIELVTPFYSPRNARGNISAIIKHLSAHGVHFIGAVHPATQSQIDPRTGKPRNGDTDKIAKIIRNKLRNGMSHDEFAQKYQNEKENKFLFRGHNFITRDATSSYATPTWRAGRSGLAYATEDANYAYGYSGGQSTHQMAGETIKPQFLHTANGDIPVGFLTVYKRNAKNIMLDNLDLESMDTRDRAAFKHLVTKQQKFPETALSQSLNPVVARYMVSGDKIVQIDETDKDWHEIMDYFTPDLNVTHADAYGHHFIQRLDNINLEKQKNRGTVKPHDLNPEQLEKMVLPPAKQFGLGRATIMNAMHGTADTQQLLNVKDAIQIE